MRKRFSRRVQAGMSAGIVLVGVLATAGSARPVVVASNPLYAIPFAAGTIDPAVDLEAIDPQDQDLILVQFEELGSTALIDRIAATRAVMVQPLAPVSYLVWADAPTTRAIRAMQGVRFAGVLPASHRIASSVTTDTTELRITFVGKLPQGMFPGIRVADRLFTEVRGSVATVPGDIVVAQRLSRLPRVYSIADAGGAPQLREERSNEVISAPSTATLQPNYRDFLAKYGADGTGVILSHVDSGADLNHPELANRVAACIDYGMAGALCNAKNHDDVIGHGTHTLGIILGNGSTGLGDLDGFDYGLGVAPGAKAVVQNAIGLMTLTGDDAFADGYTPVYKQAYDLGAILSANSWGPSGSPKGYDADTREFDSIVRDVDPAKPGDQAMGLVFSVMNGSGGTSTQGTPDEGKNLIGVGGTVDRPGDNFDDLCTCSAHGPALDGRLLPTLVAPGESVVSTRAAQGTLCGLPFASAEETPPSPLHAGCTGTSMASPHVSGAYALFVDFYRDRYDATPSPAMVKAALVNRAVDLAGGKDADGRTMGNIPDNKQGWGRLNIGNVFRAWTAGVVAEDQVGSFNNSGETRSWTVTPVDPTKPLKVTLAWTDALGPGLGGKTPAWINDLNLRVSNGTSTWLGNVFSNGMSVTGGFPDPKNNLENVFIANPGAGTFTITVQAANLIGDGRPNSGDLTDQDFALVVTNARGV